MRPMTRGFAVALITLTVLLAPAPAFADFGTPRAVSPKGQHAEAFDQATDKRGDTTYFFFAGDGFKVRTLRVDGVLGPLLSLGTAQDPISNMHVAVDDDGDGLAVWIESPSDPGMTGYVYGRRFTHDGHVGPLRRISPADHWAVDAQVAVQPSGRAVVTWARLLGARYIPYVRTVGLGGRLGAAHQVGPGPNAPAPFIAMERTGRATLLWTNDALFGRHLSADGHLSPLRKIRAVAYGGESMGLIEVAIDGRGISLAACTKWTRNTLNWPQDNSYERACWLRISPSLRLLGKLRIASADGETVDEATRVAVASNGAAVVGWQTNYFEGGWVRQVRPDGSYGRPRKVSSGGLGDIVLRGDGDGVIASSGIAGDGLTRVIRATRVRNGVIGTTVTVGRNDYDTTYLRAATTATGVDVVSWCEELDAARIMAVRRQ